MKRGDFSIKSKFISRHPTKLTDINQSPQENINIHNKSSDKEESQASGSNDLTDCANKTNEAENDTSDGVIEEITFDNLELFAKSDHTFESISQLQNSDQTLKPIMDYITRGDLPTSQKLAREILLKHSNYAVIRNVLFHCRVAKSIRVQTLKHYQLVVPELCLNL